jgi:membrane protease YdiL (CAAX protease family)
MSASTANQETTSKSIPQFSILTTLFMFAWPALWFTFIIYVVARQFILQDGSTPTWVMQAITIVGTGAELLAALVLLKREGYPLKLSALRERIRWAWPKGWKAWLVAVIVFAVGMALSMAMGPANKALAGVPGFVPPDWWPAASNPLTPVSSASEVFPDINLEGNFLFILLYFLIGLVFNILGEELYYRGYLLPRMRGAFGKWDWVVNGTLFTLKHVYQRWLYPGIFIGGLAFAFAAGPLGSLPLAMIYHWAGNFLINLVFLTMAALGMG